jgi:hypothetical protein
MIREIRRYFHNKKHLRVCHHCNTEGYDYEMKRFVVAEMTLGDMVNWYHYDCFDYISKCYESQGISMYQGSFGITFSAPSRCFTPVKHENLIDPAPKRRECTHE